MGRLCSPIGIAVILIALTNSACVPLEANKPAVTEPVVKVNSQSDLEILLDFGANLSGLSASARAENCSAWLKRHKENPGFEALTHLLVGRLYADECGDIAKLVDDVRNLPADSLADSRLRNFVTLTMDSLLSQQELSKKLQTLERKQKKAKIIVEKNTSDKKPDASLLRDKLEAIRAMEKQLDETVDSK